MVVLFFIFKVVEGIFIFSAGLFTSQESSIQFNNKQTANQTCFRFFGEPGLA